MLNHATDDFSVSYDGVTGLVDIQAQQADLLSIYNFLSRLANNYIVVKARPAPQQTPMAETICTA